jgi:hypothetical protein
MRKWPAPESERGCGGCRCSWRSRCSFGRSRRAVMFRDDRQAGWILLEEIIGDALFGVVGRAGYRVDADRDHSLRYGIRHLRRLAQRIPHISYPDRQGRAAAGFARAQRARLVVTHPGHRDARGLEPGEPGVVVIVGGAGLAGEIGSPKFQRGGCRTAADHILHQAGGNECIARSMAGCNGGAVKLLQNATVLVGDSQQMPGCYRIAAIREHRVADGQRKRRDFAGAQRHGHVGRDARHVEAEIGDVLLGELHARALRTRIETRFFDLASALRSVSGPSIVPS